MSTTYDARGYPIQNAPAYPAQQNTGADCASLMRLATTGAIVGGSAAAAMQLRKFQNGNATPTGALAETGRTALTAAVATAAAGAVASSVAEQGAMRLGLMFVVAAAVVYGIQSRMDGSEDQL